MKRLSFALLLALAACGGSSAAPKAPTPTPPTAPTPPVSSGGTAPCTAEAVAGSWSTDQGSDFEEITLEAGGAYSTYLHDRPFESGHWALDGGALVLTGDSGSTTRIDGARCGDYFTGSTDGNDVTWTPIHAGEL
ncbi:MAG TPA: hypothetical protein VHE35_34100 [Kofleriaceae bacterium]|nr:hypothetical protein [Kofleriaceae bacterium]